MLPVLILAGLASLFLTSAAQSDEHLPLTAFIASLDHAAKNSMSGMPPPAQTRLAFSTMLKAALSGNETDTKQAAGRAGYRTRRITQGGATIWFSSTCCNRLGLRWC